MAITDPKPREEARSPEWPKAREEWLKQHGSCAVCGRTDSLQVHHKHPFHLHPELELDPENFITLCEHPETNDHYVFGHLRDWHSYNPDVESNAECYLKDLQSRPYE